MQDTGIICTSQHVSALMQYTYKKSRAIEYERCQRSSVDKPDLEISPDPHVSADWPADLHRCETAARRPQPDTPSQPRGCVVHLAFSTASAMLELSQLIEASRAASPW